MKNSIAVASRGRNPDNPSDRKARSNGTFVQKLEPLVGGKTNTLSTVDKDNYIMEYERNTSDCAEKTSNRIINLFGKKVRVLGIRRLTPTECARLQTIPEWYKWECSDSQAYRMLGNGWTVEVIKHFFSFLPFAKEIK